MQSLLFVDPAKLHGPHKHSDWSNYGILRTYLAGRVTCSPKDIAYVMQLRAHF